MATAIETRQHLISIINELPAELLPDLVKFVEFLYFKLKPSPSAPAVPETAGSAFLLSIAGIGTSEETDVSERDEEILANEIDPIRGWTLNRDLLS